MDWEKLRAGLYRSPDRRFEAQKDGYARWYLRAPNYAVMGPYVSLREAVEAATKWNKRGAAYDGQ